MNEEFLLREVGFKPYRIGVQESDFNGPLKDQRAVEFQGYPYFNYKDGVQTGEALIGVRLEVGDPTSFEHLPIKFFTTLEMKMNALKSRLNNVSIPVDTSDFVDILKAYNALEQWINVARPHMGT